MAADEMQVRLTAKDDLTKELTRATKQVAKLEAQLKDLEDATGPEAERDIRKLTTQLDRAYKQVKTTSGAVSKLDEDLEQMGYSAQRAGDKVSSANRDMDKGKSSMMAFGASIKKGALAATAAAAAAVGMGLAIKKAADLTWQAANQAAAYEKKVRRTDVVFGKYAKKVRRWADESNELWGASVEDVAAMAAGIGDILKPLGFTTKQATKLTLSVGDLIPALAEWNTVGMDASQVSYALTAAMTGEREMLKSLGIVIMEEDVDAKIKAMEAAKKFTTETGKQKKAIATLKLATEGSADALKSYAGNTDSAGRVLNKLRAAAADLRDAGLDVIALTIRDLADALSFGGGGSEVQDALKWIKQNRRDIEAALLTVAGATLRIGEWSLLAGAWVQRAYGAIINQLGGMLKVLAKFAVLPWLTNKLNTAGDALLNAGVSAQESAEGMFTAAEGARDLGEGIFAARDDVVALDTALEQIKNKKVRAKVEVAITLATGAAADAVDWADQIAREIQRKTKRGGDTTVGMGTGSLGAAGLAAAHAGYSSALGGHSILSGVRGSNLGSAQSDHLRGRAMDIRGPRLGAYAQVVRRSGGYAAMHGSGANRHLHVVPQTRRPAPQMAGGNTFHADVTVVNPGAEMDIQGAVARGLRQAARQTKERG